MKTNEKDSIGIVEDDPVTTELLKITLEELGYNVIAQCDNYTDAIHMIENEELDLVLLDIELAGEKNGIDVAKAIDEEYDIPYIFLTSHTDKPTLRLAGNQLFGAYLVKPVKPEELFSAIEIVLYKSRNTPTQTAQANQKEYHDFIFVKHKNKQHKIMLTDIVYLSSDHVYTDIHLANEKKFTIRSSLTAFSKDFLGDNFVQISRKNVVNIHYVESIGPSDIISKGTTLKLTKGYRKKLLDKFNVF